MDNDKLKRIENLIENSTTFSGYDIANFSEKGLQSNYYGKGDQYKNKFFQVEKDDGLLHIPKTFIEAQKDGTPIADHLTDMYIMGYSSYSARGIRFKNLEPSDMNLLKEVFGDMIQETENKDKENPENKTFGAVLFTNIDKKNITEKAVDRTFAATGTAINTVGALGFAGSALIFSNPLTAIIALGVGIGAGLVGVVATPTGMAVAGIPKLIDHIQDKFNGDERKIALHYVNEKFSLENNGENLKFENYVVFDKETASQRIKKMQQSLHPTSSKSENKPTPS